MQGLSTCCPLPRFVVWRWFWCWMLVALQLLLPHTLRAQEAECAEVRIVIEQKMSLERQAFDAHMVISNGLDGTLSNVQVQLVLQDQDGQSVLATEDANATGAAFFQRLDSVDGMANVQSGVLQAKQSADIRWLLIPSQGAGGNSAEGRMYYVGAKVTYTLNGQTSTIDVTPDYVVVRPQPLLVLDYFLPEDVQADDPFTPEVEASEPFTLGVRVSNIGAGLSANTRIESAQPKIVDNKQGLLIDFRILGGYVANTMLGQSLLLDFGDIAGGAAVMGRWLMETSLAGRFTEFKASYSHADSLGGAVTSLIAEQGVRSHWLVHDVLVDLPGHDAVYDFLAREGTQYRVYDSAGGDSPVVDVSGAARLSSQSTASVRLQFTPTQGLVHAKLADPRQGRQQIARVLRSDGKQLHANNYWLSKHRNEDLSWSYFVHVFDSDSTGDYTLEYTAVTTASLSGMAYLDANGNGLQDAQELPDGNAQVTLQGVENSGKHVLREAYTDSKGLFTFTQLQPGSYQLTGGPRDGWVDGVWQAGSAGGKAESGLISEVVLNAGTQATSYVLAKRKPQLVQQQETDVSITAVTSQAKLQLGDQTTVEVTVKNVSGIAAEQVQVQLPMPDALQLVAAHPSMGSFGQGVWQLATLQPGASALLTLTIMPGTSGGDASVVNWGMQVGSTTRDSNTANNQITLGLHIDDQPVQALQVSQSLAVQKRVMMLTACGADTACQLTEQTVAKDVLGELVDALQLAHDAQAWAIAMRSGGFNVLWLRGGVDALDALLRAELDAAVQRGALLVLERDAGVIQQWDGLLKLFPENPHLPLSNQESLLQISGFSDTLPTVGAGVALTPVSASQTLATWNGGSVAAQRRTHGAGSVWMSGFDLLQSARTALGEQRNAWLAHLGQQLEEQVGVVDPQSVLAHSQLLLKAGAHNVSDTTWPVAQLMQSWNPALKVLEALPAGEHQAQAYLWTQALQSQQTMQGVLRVRMPGQAGWVEVNASAQAEAQSAPSEAEVLRLQVLDEPALAQRVQALLPDLHAQSIESAMEQVNKASDVLTRLQALAQAYVLVQDLPLSDASTALQLTLARWIGVLEYQWLPDAVSPVAQQLLAYGGMAQQAVIGAAFAQPLQVQVLDGKGQVMAGARIEFSLPKTGATAQFVDGGWIAQAMTDAQGIATSPAFQANGVIGRYAAKASLNGLSASFDLTNIAATDNGDAGNGSDGNGNGDDSSNPGAGLEYTLVTGTGVVSVALEGATQGCRFDEAGTEMTSAEREGALIDSSSFSLPHGLLAFKLVGCQAGSAVTVTTKWPHLSGVTGYLKYGPTPTSNGESVWYEPDNLRLDLNNRTATYTVTDGGLGDDDLVANGVIVDPGGPVVGTWSAGPAVPGSTVAVPGLQGIGLTILSALLGLFAVCRRRLRTALLAMKTGEAR